MAVVIQFRRGTAAQWTSTNPILAQGEPGLETDTLKWKAGDGNTAWSALPYSTGGPGPAGPQGPPGGPGPAGATGATGPAGPGVPVGGAVGTVLTKNSATDFDTVWNIVQGLPADTIVPSTTRIIANKLAGADTQPAWRVMGDGKLQWGPGATTALDTNLYRLSAATLQTDGSLNVQQYLTCLMGVWSQRTATSLVSLATYLPGDASDRFEILAGGQLNWGPGNAATDTNLYRSQANVLKTDGHFRLGQDLTVGMVSGAGTIYFGSAYDTNLYRPSANKLQTDGALDAKGGFTVNGAPIGNIAYQGAYSASQTYHDGDIVVGADGITYQCVKEGTVGITPAPWSAPPPSPIPYGTTLPTVTYDGMEAILVDSVTNPSYQWRFRYNAGSTSAYKWEFIGGVPILRGPSGSTTNPGTAAFDLSGGPVVTVPRSGVYQLIAGISFNIGVSTGPFDLWTQVTFSTTGSFNLPMADLTPAWAQMTQESDIAVPTLVAGETGKLRVWTAQAAPNANFNNGIIKLTPVRVS